MTPEPRQALEVTEMKLLPALGVAIAAVATATLARALLFRYFAANLPCLTFFPAVLAATLCVGFVAGLAATLLCALAYQVHIPKPVQTSEFLAAVANVTGRTG
jgi:K+-sensing histidine kinase KdpD